ncbi:MAG: ABC transporter ATP-binding protein [Muribaculaceae bacterium]|nr:ABC transporter ATP-binding protein [Muribaculaceae bacterium]
MFSLNNLSFSYKKRGGELFHDLSLELTAGNIYGLLGKNGAGKSTLINLMTGLLTPMSGEVTLDGVNVRDRLPKTMSDIYLIPEEFDLPHLTLKQYVSINTPFYPNFSMDDLQRYLDIFEMGGDMDVKLHSLSMGQKKKVFLAFAFATNTRVLIMDEPTNGLDIPSKSQFRKLVTTGMTDDKMMLISTHQVRDISEILDHVTILDQSRVLLNASITDVMSRLAFRPMQEGDQPLFVQPSVMGSLVVVPAQPDEETAVDLEMLFNATLQNPDAINQLFNASK